ncbi:MAG: FtsQ-type POTRA domain-containing protein [Candidatus Paceibacterota bacterium]
MSASRKLHQFKRKKPIYKSRFFWISIAVLLIVSALFYLIVFASFFDVEEFKISGNQKINEDNIREIAVRNFPRKLPFVTSRTVFLADIGQIRTKIRKKFPIIHEVKVQRRLPNKLEIMVGERKPVATFLGNKNYLIDKRGVVFEATTSDKGFLIDSGVEKVKPGERIISRETMDKILTIETKLKEMKIKKAVLKSKSRLDVITQAGWKAYFDLSKDWEWQISKLKIALEREISETEWKDLNYIDLRFDKIYYK